MSIILLTQTVAAQTKKATKPIVENAPKNEALKIVSFEVLSSGDTVNRVDSKNNKVGKWLITKDSKYGEEGFMEFGAYDKNNKMGTWKTYSLSGQIISIENFKSDRRDGEARYFENGYLYCIGNYLALKAKNEYDTILVEDPLTNLIKPVRIKTDLGSVRHGFWTYYTPGSKKIEKVLEYQADEVIYEKEYLGKTDSVYLEKKMKSLPHNSNKPSDEVWNFDKNKKSVKYTDIPDNTKSVVPNVRKK
jgi:antitoxin component YwqK of YwqJK toxin-antitoxin module